ncbi:MAG: TIGR02281 family clan AA aspartic protease [Pseudomonadota bacterium]
MRTALLGVAVLVIGGIVLIINHDSGVVAGLQTAELAQIVVGVALLIWLSGSVLDRDTRFSHVVRNVAIWLAIAFVIVLGYTYRAELETVGQRVLGELMPSQPRIAVTGGDVTISRDAGGHFVVDGDVNGSPVRFLVDTGASRVALPASIAESSGVDPDSLRYTIAVSTANGQVMMAGTRLAAVTIGGITVPDVQAFIAPDSALSNALLGMTYLDRLPGYSVRGNALVLHASD